ncbi:MAG: hypothetical protein RLZZ543_564 [Bacteroidota bacterium]
MIRFNYIIPTFLLLLVLMSSCEQVIDLPLRDSDARLVIEGGITDDPGSCRVRLSRVVNYDQSNDPLLVSGATVLLYDNGTEYTLSEVETGMYVNPQLIGIPGHEYRLVVTADGETYSSISKMNSKVEIDSLSFELQTFFFDTNLVTHVHFKDPAGIENYYRYRSRVRDSISKDIQVERDVFFDGQDINQPLFGNGPRLKPGDTMFVELWGIDKGVYEYYSTLNEILGGAGPSTASPANPTSNITGGAMGYFSAFTIARKFRVVN